MKDLTPARMQCGGTMSSCPSIHRLEDGRLLIVGAGANVIAEKAGVSRDSTESAVIIEGSLLDELKAGWVKEAVAAENKRCGDIFIEALGFSRPSVEKALAPSPQGDDNGRGPVPETIAPAAQIQDQPDETSG